MTSKSPYQPNWLQELNLLLSKTKTNKKIGNFICLSPKLDYSGLRSHFKKDTILYLLHHPPPKKNPYRREELLLAIKTVRTAHGSVASSQACRKSHLSTKESAVYLSNSALVLFANQEVESSPSIPLQFLPNVLETQMEQKSSLTETPTTKPI